MANLLKAAQEWMDGQRRSHCTDTIAYTRGTDTVELAGTLGRSQHEIDDGNGALIRVDSVDWIFTSADLLPTFNEPAVGDRITEATGEVWMVTTFGVDPCWRYTDDFRHSLRVHTRRVEA